MRLDLAPLFSPANRGLRLPPPVMALPLQLPKPLDFSSFLSEAASSSPLAASRSRSEFKLRAVEDSDVNELAVLCTDSFFGTHELADGPIIFMQRLQILLRVRKQLARRIGFEDDDRECRLVVAEDARSGRIVGCLDLAVHLYDRDQERFYLTIEVMPETPGGPLGPFERNKYAWRSYLASYPDPDPDPDPNPDPDPDPGPSPNPNPEPDQVRMRGLRWKAVAALLPGRTESGCRNRWVRNQEREFAAAGLHVHGAAAVFAALDAARQQEQQQAAMAS